MAKSTARRSKGEGAIWKAADGRIRGSLVLPHPDGVRTVRRFVSARTRAEVSRKLEALRQQAAAGGPTAESLGAYLQRWLVAVKPHLRPATWGSYAQHVRDYWTPGLGAIALTRLAPSHVEGVMARLLESGRSPATVQRARATLRRALHDAQRDGLVNRNAAALARPPRVERREMRALTPDEVRRLLQATADLPIVALAVTTGLRLGELLGLRWSDIDLDARTLVVRRALARTHSGGYALAEPKTARSRRTVVLGAVALEALRRRRVQQAADRLAAGSAWQDTDGAVFTDALGRLLDPREVSRSFRRLADRLGLPVRFHDLRHTAASLMLAGGVPLKVVSDVLGHSSIAITADVYAHVAPDARREAAEALDRALR